MSSMSVPVCYRNELEMLGAALSKRNPIMDGNRVLCGYNIGVGVFLNERKVRKVDDRDLGIYAPKSLSEKSSKQLLTKNEG